MPPPNKRANGRPLLSMWTNDFVPPSVAASQLPERRRWGHWCLSLAAPRHIVVYLIFSPHHWYLNHKGEHFISLLGEEGGSCLSERACWIKGVISPEGGIWEWVSLRQCSLSHYLSLCMLPGSPGFDFSSSPFPLLHHVILSFFLSYLPSSRTHPVPHRCYISSHSLPSSPAGYIAALQGMENCVVRRMVVIPITPQMQRGSSKVQNNWQVSAATDNHSILVLYVCECACA